MSVGVIGTSVASKTHCFPSLFYRTQPVNRDGEMQM